MSEKQFIPNTAPEYWEQADVIARLDKRIGEMVRSETEQYLIRKKIYWERCLKNSSHHAEGKTNCQAMIRAYDNLIKKISQIP